MDTSLSVATSLQAQITTTATLPPVVTSTDADHVEHAEHEHEEHEHSKVTQFDNADAMRLLKKEVLHSLAKEYGSGLSVSDDLGFAPPDDPDQTSLQLAGTVRGILGTPATSLDSTVAPVDSQLVTAGIEAGYQETVRLLAQKGAIPTDVQIELQQSRDFAMAAVAETAIAGNPATTDPAAAGTAVTDPATTTETAGATVVSLASEATASRSAVITVTTQDGDTVDLLVSFERTAQASAAMIDGSDGTAVSMQSDQTRNFQFSLNVDGDLDRGETKAIRKLFHKIESTLHKFAEAEYGEAIEKFAKLKLNTEELANVAMDLSSSRSITVAGLYAAAATPLPATDGTTTDTTTPVPAGTSNVPDAGSTAPAPAAPNQSIATAVHLATNRSISFSPNSLTLQHNAEAAYSQTSTATTQSAPPVADNPDQAVADLAGLLEPFVSMFRDMLSNTHFSNPGELIAGLTAALVDLQASLAPVNADDDSDSSVPAPADTDPSAPPSDNAANTDSLAALTTLLQDFMGALDNDHDKHHDKHHHHDHHDHEHHHEDHHKISRHGNDHDQALSIEVGEEHDDD